MTSSIDPSYLAFIGIFIGALLAFEGVRQLLSRGKEDRVKSRRMRMIKAGATPGEVLSLLKEQNDSWTAGLPFLSDLPRRLQTAGLTIRPGLFVLLCPALAALLFVVASSFAGPLVGASAAMAGLLIPFVVVEARRKKRIEKMVSQLPDALELMSRGLRVGHPLNTTLASVANEMPDPIATEFGIVVDQVSYGDDLIVALKEMARRFDQEDLHYFTVSVGIQHGAGGNLSRVLSVLAKVIRDRSTMRRKIVAISAEGRGSMWILSALPPLIFCVVNVMTPDYYQGIMDDPLYTPIMLIIVVLVVANFLVMRKLVNFKF